MTFTSCDKPRRVQIGVHGLGFRMLGFRDIADGQSIIHDTVVEWLGQDKCKLLEISHSVVVILRTLLVKVLLHRS